MIHVLLDNTFNVIWFRPFQEIRANTPDAPAGEAMRLGINNGLEMSSVHSSDQSY